MNRSIFLSLNDDDFWGNNSEGEEEKDRKLIGQKMKNSVGEQKDSETKGDWFCEDSPRRQRSSPSPGHLKEKKNSFLASSNSSFGGFSKVNTASNLKTPPSARKKQKKLSSGDFSSSPSNEKTGDPLHAPAVKNPPPLVGLSPGERAVLQRAELGSQLLSDLGLEKKTNCGLRCPAMNLKLYSHHNPGPEMYSRKVFVGGLPPDVDEDRPSELQRNFEIYGKVRVDWPAKLGDGVPRGYVFLIFEKEDSVKQLVKSCLPEDDKIFFLLSHQKRPWRVQIRAWLLADSDYVVHEDTVVDPKKTIFVGGIPRPLRAMELAHIMEQLYGRVLVAGIDIDVDYKYPKGTGAGRVVFEYWDSYRRALKDRYVQLSHGEAQKRVELKPYTLEDRRCEECRRQPATAFCSHKDCLQYYCHKCWQQMHSWKEEEHKPIVV